MSRVPLFLPLEKRPKLPGNVANAAVDSTLSDAGIARLRNRRIGIIFQSAQLVGSLSVLDNVVLPALLAGEGRARREQARELLSRLGLHEREDFLPHMLSFGQRRRVGIARALVMSAPLILADEPTNDLDPRRAAQVAEFLLGLPAQGHALLLVTHDEALARATDKSLRLENGVLQPLGTKLNHTREISAPASGEPEVIYIQ